MDITKQINMKNIRFIATLFVGAGFLFACGSGTEQSTETTQELRLAKQGQQPVAQHVIPVGAEGQAILTFESDSFNFGTVKVGEIVEHEFTLTNTGEAPLIISNVHASCGCTTPDYSKAPIGPGEKGMVKVRFDSNGQMGNQHKIVTVTSNAMEKNTLLHVRGEVVR